MAQKFIVIQGGWYVGSTAIREFLGDSTQTYVFKKDFNIWRSENGIFDLISSRKFSDTLLIWSSIVCVTFKEIRRVFKCAMMDSSSYEFEQLIESILLIFFLLGYLLVYCFNEPFRCSYWAYWPRTVGYFMSRGRARSLVLMNPFYYDGNFDGHTTIWPQVFSNIQLIFVYRDPRDQWFDLKKSGSLNNKRIRRFHGDSEFLTDEEMFLQVSKSIYHDRLKILNSDLKTKIVIFEDFVMKENVRNDLLIFLGLQDTMKQESTFLASESLPNIGKGDSLEFLKPLMSEYLSVKKYINES